MPSSAALPDPVIIEVGVARPSAHGHAITRVEQRQDTACPMFPGSITQYQRQKIPADIKVTTGTNTVAILSASLAIGAFSF